MKKNNSLIKGVVLTGASFAGYNIGSGFATGVEALQFFGSWGLLHGYVALSIAFLFALIVLSTVYVAGQENQFKDSGAVYQYFFGRKLGKAFDFYIYVSMVIVTLVMISGAGATIHQYCRLPEWLGASVMAVVCILASLLGLDRLKRVLGYITIFIIVFVLGLAVYVLFTSDTTPAQGALHVNGYVARGQIMQASTFGVKHWLLSGFASAGMLISSGFAWAASIGPSCKSRKEAVLSGVFSSVFFYATTGVVIYLLLVSMRYVVDRQVPILAIVQHYLPALAVIYSLIIVMAIFSTVTGRLFSIADHYGGGNIYRKIVIVLVISACAVIGTTFIPFSIISNFMFLVCGAAGILMGLSIIVSFSLKHMPLALRQKLPRSVHRPHVSLVNAYEIKRFINKYVHTPNN